MRFYKLLLIVFLIGYAKAQVIGNYDAVVSANGNAFVMMELIGNGTINVPLPLDVESPTVRGALYLTAVNGIDISFDSESIIAYSTQLLTHKEGEIWTFWAELPNISFESAVVSLPDDASIIATEPEAFIEQGDESVEVTWKDIWGEDVAIDYRFVQIRKETTTTIPVAVPEGGSGHLLWIAVLLMLIIVLLIYWRGRSKLVLSKGKRNVMKIMTGNEYRIVVLLLEYKDGLKRSILERKLRIAKSSLAFALYNLEQKNILTLDKTGDWHHVALTEWFKSL